MKYQLLATEKKYDGTQMHSLFAYLGHKILGDSIVSWVAPCHISFQHMLDGEDLLEQSPIQGDLMLHFIVEVFEKNLFSGVLMQRLLTAICKDVLEDLKPGLKLLRSGDDLYLENQKLSISIATQSPVSTMIHFAMNVTNKGTPVKTLALVDDLGMDPVVVADKVMRRFVDEFNSVTIATKKVKPVG